MNIDKITKEIIGAAIEVHRQLGPGMLESAYKQALAYELRIRKIKFMMEVKIPIPYKEIKLDCGFRADLIVENCIVVELKAQRDQNDIFEAQVLTNTKLLKWGCQISCVNAIINITQGINNDKRKKAV